MTEDVGRTRTEDVGRTRTEDVGGTVTEDVKSAHPLDPLTAAEMVAACTAVREWPEAPWAGGALAFPIVALVEPDKGALRSWRPGSGRGPRRAEVVVLERQRGETYEVIVRLDEQGLRPDGPSGGPDEQTSGVVESHQYLPGVKPALLFEDSINAVEAVKTHPGWQEAMRKRGVTDFEHVQIDPWPAGNFGAPIERERRIARCVSYTRANGTDNGYAHPVEGLVAVVDLATSEVIELLDEGPVPIPTTPGNYSANDVGALRTDLRSLEITQADGPSFEVVGHEIRWQRWRFRFSVHPIEGLVLHQVTYEDQGRHRPILDRASIAEMVVPYGARSSTHYWKNAFDAGEWGLGRMIQPLALGCDCLGEIRYFDAIMPDDSGGARNVTNAVCLHEEDYGILWKHVDLWSGNAEVRRSRRLVISSIATVGNYEYGFYWYFYLDGTIQLEVKLTGIIQTGAIGAGELDDHGSLVAPGLWGPNHQHLFCARLDVAVDGPTNRVEELDVVGLPRDATNPHGNAIVARATLLETEVQARRVIDPLRSRSWKISNPTVHNALDEPVAYRLVPGPAVTLLADPSASVSERAAFARHNLWVTPYHPAERRPAGNHPNQSAGGDGLLAWGQADRSIVDADIVLWYCFGISHVPRPEDWPVMPVEYAGFALKPFGFFDRNPALDVPASASEHCGTAQHASMTDLAQPQS